MTSLPSSLQVKLNQIHYMVHPRTSQTDKAATRQSIVASLPPDKIKGKLLSTYYGGSLPTPVNQFRKVLDSRVLEKDANDVAAFAKAQLYGLEWELELAPEQFPAHHVGRELLSRTLINCCGIEGAEHKGDGSLSSDYGREVVFKPATLFELKDMLTKIKLTNFEGAISDARTRAKAGVHIHVDDKVMTTLGYIKLWGLINLSSNVPFWKVYGRRYLRHGDDKYRYCNWTPCSLDELIKWSKQPSLFVQMTSSRSKYCAIRDTNRGTLEIRMFNGAPIVDELLEYVEAVASMCDWTHNSKLIGDYDVSSWIEFVDKNKHVYPNAWKRCKEVQEIFHNHYHGKLKKHKLPSHVIPSEAS